MIANSSTVLFDNTLPNVLGGLVVMLIGYIAVKVAKVGKVQRHTHEALWGFDEGTTHKPGLVEIVQGNGHGNLLQICERAEGKADANGVAVAAVASLLQDHIDTDDTNLAGITAALAGLAHGQSSAAQTADAVSVELHGVPVKPAPRKRAPRKRTQPEESK